MHRNPLRVAVVDDDDAIRELMAEYLRGRGFLAEAFADGASACASIAARPPDAMVTDLKLPDMSGVDLVHAAARCMPPVPVVVTTGYGTVEAAVASLKTGATDFILKPFRLRDLHAALERAIERARRERQAWSDREALGLFQQAELASRPEDADALVRALLDLLGRIPACEVAISDAEGDGSRPLGSRRHLHAVGLPESAVPCVLAVHRALLRCES